MNERDFFDEKPETKRANYSCARCRRRFDIPNFQTVVFI
jgi:hypothetical protein